jgi:hypothetical protein
MQPKDTAMKLTFSSALTALALMAIPVALTACDQKTETKETKKETTTTNPAPTPAPDQSTTTTTTTTEKKD